MNLRVQKTIDFLKKNARSITMISTTVLVMALCMRFFQLGKMIYEIRHSKFFIENVKFDKNSNGLCNLTVNLDVNSEANFSLSKIQIDLICESMSGEKVTFAKFKCNDLKLIKKKKIAFSTWILTDHMDIPRLLAIKGPKKYYISYKVLLQIRILMVQLAFGIKRRLEVGEKRHKAVNSNEFFVRSLSRKVIDHSFKRMYVDGVGYYRIALKADHVINKDYVGSVDFYFEDLLVEFYKPSTMYFKINKINISTETSFIDVLLPIKTFSTLIADGLTEYWKIGKVEIQVLRITDNSDTKNKLVIYEKTPEMDILKITLPFGKESSKITTKMIRNIKVTNEDISADFAIESSTVLLTVRDILRKLLDEVTIRGIVHFNGEYLCDVFLKIPEENCEVMKHGMRYGTSFSLARFVVKFNDVSTLAIYKKSIFKGMSMQFKVSIIDEQNVDAIQEMCWIEKLKVSVLKGCPPILSYEALEIPLFINKKNKKTASMNAIEHWTLPITEDEILNIQTIITNHKGNRPVNSSFSVEIPDMTLSLFNSDMTLKSKIDSSSFLETVSRSSAYHFSIKTSLFTKCYNAFDSLAKNDKILLFLEIQNLIRIKVAIFPENDGVSPPKTVLDLNFDNLNIQSLDSFKMNVYSDNYSLADTSPLVINRIRIFNPIIKYKNVLSIISDEYVELELISGPDCNIIRLRKAVDFEFKPFPGPSKPDFLKSSHIANLFDHIVSTNVKAENAAVDIFDGIALIKAKLHDSEDGIDFSMSISVPEEFMKLKFLKDISFVIRPKGYSDDDDLRMKNSLSIGFSISSDCDFTMNGLTDTLCISQLEKNNNLDRYRRIPSENKTNSSLDKTRKIAVSVKGMFPEDFDDLEVSFFVDQKLKDKKTITQKDIIEFWRNFVSKNIKNIKHCALDNILHVEPLSFRSISETEVETSIKIYTEQLDILIRRLLNQAFLLKKAPRYVNLDLDVSKLPSLLFETKDNNGTEIPYFILKNVTANVSNVSFRPCYTKDEHPLLSTRSFLNELYSMNQYMTAYYLCMTKSAPLDSRIFDMPILVNFVMKVEDLEALESSLVKNFEAKDTKITLSPSVIKNVIHRLNVLNKTLEKSAVVEEENFLGVYMSEELFKYAFITLRNRFVVNFIKKPISFVFINSAGFCGCFRFFGLQTDERPLGSGYGMSLQFTCYNEFKSVSRIFNDRYNKFTPSTLSNNHTVIGVKGCIIFDDKTILAAAYIPNFNNIRILNFITSNLIMGVVNTVGTENTLNIGDFLKLGWLTSPYKESMKDLKKSMTIIKSNELGLLYRFFEDGEMRKAKDLALKVMST